MHAGGRDDLLKLSVRTSARAASSEDESPVRELHFKYDWPEGHTRCRMSLSALGTYVNCAVPRGLEAFSPVRCISFFFWQTSWIKQSDAQSPFGQSLLL
jgi:hypothetical protein